MGAPNFTQITLSGGIDQSVRGELADPERAVLNAENTRQVHTGGRSTRYGFSSGSVVRIDGTTRSTGHRMYADGQTTCVIDASSIDSQSVSAGVSTNHGRLPEALSRMIDLPANGSSSYLDDVEYCNGYFAVSSYGGSSVGSTAVVVDAVTGAVVAGPYSFGTANAVRIGSYSTYFIAFVFVGSTGITAYYLNTSSYSTINTGWVSLGSVSTAWTANPTMQAGYCSVASMSDRVAVAFMLETGVNRVAVQTWNASGVVETTTLNSNSTTPAAVDVAIGPNADTLWVVWNETTAVKACGLAPTAIGTPLGTTATVITATSSPNYPKVVAHSATSSKARVLTYDPATWARIRIQSITISAGAVAQDGTGKLVPCIAPAARPFAYNSRYYVLAHGGGLIATTTAPLPLVVVDWTDDVTFVRPVCSVESALGVSNTGYSKAVTGATSTKKYVGVNILRSSVAVAQQLAELDFASSNRWQPVTFGNSTYLSGGVVGYFDGQRFNEASFLHRPPKPTTSTGGTGVTLTLGRRYIVVYEALDADGNWTVSGVSDPSDSTGAVSNKTITVTSQPCAMTYRLDSSGLALASSRAVLYATADNAGVPPYYRLQVKDNDTSSATIAFTDTTTDATLTANAKLYEQPGINGSAQDRRAPPGCAHLVAYNGLLVAASGSNVWYSGQPVIGETAWFNPIFQIPVEGEGEITALAAQDGTLFIFKRRGIWAISGEWPSDNAASGGLGQPRRLAVDVGCIEQRSIVVTALGILFQSDRGIEILTRAQSVEWIGESVQDELASRPYVNAATLDQGECVVYFELSSGRTSGLATGTGRGLVYDLSRKQWESVDRRYDQAGTADSPAQSACMIWSNSAGAWRYGWLDVSGYVYTEDQTTYLDPGARFVTPLIETAHFKPAGLQGLVQVNSVGFLGKRVTDHDLNIALRYDYASSYKTATTWTRAQIATVTGALNGGQLQLSHAAHNDADACEAVSVKLYASTPTGGTVGTGAGPVFIGLVVDATPTGQPYPLPTEAT